MIFTNRLVGLLSVVACVAVAIVPVVASRRSPAHAGSPAQSQASGGSLATSLAPMPSRQRSQVPTVSTRPVLPANPGGPLVHVPPVTGVFPGGYFGNDVSPAGDVDGDGIDDFMVGAPLEPGLSVAAGGRVHLYSGATRVEIHLAAPLAGWNTDDEFGKSIDVIGDFDNDGVRDLLIGAPQLSVPGATGYVQIRSGATGAILLMPTPPAGVAAGTGFGHTVANVGDLDQDGFEDFAVAAPFAGSGNYFNAGIVQVYSGQTGLAYPFGKFSGTGSNYYLGWGLDAAGDVDADGLPDLVMGAFGAGNGTGVAYVVSGSWIQSGFGAATLLTRWGMNNTDGFGSCVAGVGDVNQDGFDDVLIGTLYGNYALVVGRQGGQTMVCQFIWDVTSATAPGVTFGISVAAGGDVDGDGVPDFLVGGGSNPAGTRSVVRCYSGSDGSLIRSVRGPNGGQMYGLSCALLPDTTGNGAPEILVGAPEYGAPSTGAVYFYSN